MAWPLFASAQTPVVRNITDEAFQQWLKEDNKLIEGILQSLTHIDSLVTDIQRMLVQLPDAGQLPPAAPIAAPPAPVVIEKTVIQEVPGPLGGWMPQLAGAALLALLAFWLGRRQNSAQGVQARPIEEIAPKPVAATPKPAAPPLEKRTSPPPAATPSVTGVPTTPQQAAPAVEPVTPSIPAAQIDRPSTDQSDQALELAEIMLSMGLGHGATQTLVEQIRSEPKQALRHWLKLLDIYRKNGQQEEFERSSEELRQHFNVRTEDWQVHAGGKQSLEDFPHIAHRLVELWGKADCLVYMRNLLDDNRGGARSGFPQSVAEELLLLTAVLRDVCGFTPNG